MANEIKIVEGVFLDTLNPRNYALKNEYFSNLLSTAFMILPCVDRIVHEPIQVVKGFLSGSYLKEEFPNNYTAELERHSRGLALELAWKGWDIDTATRAAYEIYDKVSSLDTEKIKILINVDKKRLYIGREFKETSIVEKTSGQERVIRKD